MQMKQFFCCRLKFESHTRKSFGNVVNEVLTPKASHSRQVTRSWLTKQTYEGSHLYIHPPLSLPSSLSSSRLVCLGYKDQSCSVHLLRANSGTGGECWRLNKLLLTDVSAYAQIWLWGTDVWWSCQAMNVDWSEQMFWWRWASEQSA